MNKPFLDLASLFHSGNSPGAYHQAQFCFHHWGLQIARPSDGGVTVDMATLIYLPPGMEFVSVNFKDKVE